MEKITPVILGADMAAYSIARIFYEEYQFDSVVFSKYNLGATDNSSFIKVNTYLDLDEQVLEILTEYARKKKGKKILFGCGDWYVRLIIENKKELEKYYLIPYIDEKLLNKIVHKKDFYSICEELNIPYPVTLVLENKSDINKIKLPFEYPIILKPSNSVKYHYSDFEGKKKVYKIDSEIEFKHVFKKIYSSSYDDKLIIQEYIEGDDTSERVLTCYCDKNSNVVFSSLGQIALEEKSPTAIGNYVAIINDFDKTILENAKRFLKKVKYRGVANFDLKYDPKTKEFKFFEINVRLGRSNYYASMNGYNIAKYIYEDYVLNKSQEGETISKETYLYTVAPISLLKRYIDNKQVLKKIKRLKKEKKVANPIIYKKDLNIKRLIYIFLSLVNYYIKFYKYNKKER